ncbi:hypothetical protein AAMO2058_001731900 [Amorphochlora amoebiformis]
MASCHRPPAVLLQPSRRLGVKPFLLIILVGTLALAGSSLPRRNGDMGRAVSQLHSRARVQEGVRLWRRATPSEILRRGTIKIRADMSGRDGGAKEKKIRELGVEAKTGADRVALSSLKLNQNTTENSVVLKESRQVSRDESTSIAAAGILASSAFIFEVVQFLGTALLVYFIHLAIPEATTFEEAIVLLTGNIQSMGAAGYLAYAGVQILLQVFPIASAFAMTVSAGVVFGSVKKGVAVVSLASTFSAGLSFVISRELTKGQFKEFKEKSRQLTAIDTALADAGFFNSVLLTFLLRSSPIIPFSWANYLFGLSRVPLIPFVLGTFFGTLPGITAMVSAGLQTSQAISGGAGDFTVQAGLVTTLLSIVLIGRVSDMALKKLDIDLEGDSSSSSSSTGTSSSS